jgi:hypothetical protein
MKTKHLKHNKSKMKLAKAIKNVFVVATSTPAHILSVAYA